MRSVRGFRIPIRPITSSTVRSIAMLVASVAVGMLTIVAASTPAQAADLGKVSSISIKDTYSELTFAFDQPISAAEAKEIQTNMEIRSSTVRPATAQPVDCWTGGSFIDSNGSFSYQRRCNAVHTVLWGFQLSASNQATVVGLVNEVGLRWWCDYQYIGQNAPHTEPPYYLFHGVMNPVYTGTYVDFQDYLTWRHNIGSGGTASLAVAGTLYMVI